MKTNYIKRFLMFGLLIGVTACNSNQASAQKGDQWLRYKVHKSIVPQKPNWQSADFKHMSYFGRYRASADAFQRYGGDPLGPIVAIWQVKRFLGEKPTFIACGKKPKLSDELVWNTPEYKIAKNEKNKLLSLFNECRINNTNIEQQSATSKYYYARSTNNYSIIAQPRPENHASYEVNVSYGPLIGLSAKSLNAKQFAIKDQLYYGDCRNLALPNADKSCYRLPGNDANLYYNIRSLLRQPTSNQKARSPYQRAPLINDISVTWEEIKGINISAVQYAYLEKRCQKIFECYLDENTPELNAEQKAYIQQTTWDIDTDFVAQDKLIEKANDFRFHQN